MKTKVLFNSKNVGIAKNGKRFIEVTVSVDNEGFPHIAYEAGYHAGNLADHAFDLFDFQSERKGAVDFDGAGELYGNTFRIYLKAPPVEASIIVAKRAALESKFGKREELIIQLPKSA